MIAGVARETFPDERRVAVVPAVVPALAKGGFDVLIEAGAGDLAGYPDRQYTDKGARIAAHRAEVFGKADVVLQVRGYGANPDAGRGDLDLFRRGQAVIAYLEPLFTPQHCRELAGRGVTAFAMELIPRVTRAQSMDSLSSMATVAGYKAVLVAADFLPKMFPLLMTAAGSIAPARLFVIGAGVAGLQAISTAHRLGAVVQAYDVRPAVKEQVESVGGEFVELALETDDTEAASGYAKAMDDAFYRRQGEMMAQVVAESDAVIATAAVPGKKAPVLITADMVAGMHAGSVIIDLAAERGGNCELTRPGQTIVADGVTIIGPTNLPATVPYHASQMYAKNIATFLLHLVRDGQWAFDMDDEITRATLVARDGQVVNPAVRDAVDT